MWIFGLIVGMLVGGAAGGGGGAFAGAVIGALIGAVFRSMTLAETDRRINSLEEKYSTVSASLAALQRQIDQIERNAMSAAESRLPATEASVVQRAESGSAPDDLVSERIAPEFVAPGAKTDSAAPQKALAERIDVEEPRESAVDARGAQMEAPTNAGSSPVFDLVRRWFFGGNTVLKAGIIVLFFGVAFLIKYAADSGVLPIELRLAGVAAGGMALLVLGFRLRNRGDGKAAYGLALQGAGVGVLYLVVFGAFRAYHLLPGGLAFALMVGLVALSAALAVLQNSLALAVFGSVGGFLAPVLASTGGGSHVGLFSFYAILNAGIVAIAWFKAWRVLNVIGFGFTFGIASLWGARSYRLEFFASTEPFLVLFFLFYVAIAVLFALREAPRLRSVVDGTLVFGTPVAAFGLQAALVRHIEYGAAFSAIAVALFYLLLANWLHARRRDDLRLLTESFLALAVIFITLAVPLALDGRWTSAVWAVEGAAIVWAGSRQGKWLARAFGYLVQAGGGLALFSHWGDGAPGLWPVLDAQWLGVVLTAGAALFTAYLIERRADRFNQSERDATLFIFLYGLAMWLIAGITEITKWSGSTDEPQRVALFLTATAWAFHLAARRLDWRYAAKVPLTLLPALVVTLFWSLGVNRHAFAESGWLIWPVALAAHYRLLFLMERRADRGNAASVSPKELIAALHTLGVWTIALTGAHELHWAAEAQGLGRSAWSVTAPLLAVSLVVISTSSAWMRQRWPVAPHLRATLVHGLAPLMFLVWLWVFYANLTHDGTSAPLPYLPLLNAIDLGHALALLALLTWTMALKSEALDVPLERGPLLAAGGAACFVWLNGVLLRTIHHWADVPYRLDALLRSLLTQTALSIFWTVLALALMLVATRRSMRTIWFTGAILMAVVVAKLFLVDLSNIGGIERIVSFIGVGILMLVIGYVAPLPPKTSVGKELAEGQS